MKLIFTFTLLILSALALEQECLIFGCGNINQEPQSPRKGVESFEDGHFNVEYGIDPLYHCNAINWKKAEEAEPTRCIETQALTQQFLPGDICTKDTDGFGNTDDISCTKEVGATTKASGDSCPDTEGFEKHKYCPVGTFCQDEVCTEQHGKDVVCEGDNSCKFGLKCIAQNTALNDYRGAPVNSIGNEVKFKTDRIINGQNIWNGFNSMCLSYNSVSTDQTNVRICRKADYSQNQEEYRRDSPGDTGEYTRFSEEFPIEGEPKNDIARCGFNRDTGAYCMMRKGDSWFKERFQNFTETDLIDLKCHTMSNVESCKDFIDTLDENVIYKFNQSIFAVDENLGYHLFANNDRGVGRAITTQFWNGRNPGLAYMAATALPVIFVSTLTLLF